ncbi:nucleotidyltransferase family protein [Planococcus ruber]|uniref:nucleotidyltransferase family protein n=1 Tax=Planococcus ruber TaxID=2027871 RepID=UPI001FEEA134|nr:nucleotidyltransferase family protein [Planococcus ruber]MCJ1907594.1 nucleotidyltransferase family protein [Planococcus ruber]
MKNEQDILQAIEADAWMMAVLEAAKRLDLPDWWICAGFVRTKLWDALHGFNERTPLGDIDVVYFNPEAVDEAEEKRYEEKLHQLMPDLPWSVKNEARMQRINDLPPYASSIDAISKFPETATALAVKLDERGQLILAAPCGISDALNLIVRPTPHFIENKELGTVYENRLKTKNWLLRWPRLTIYQVNQNS